MNEVQKRTVEKIKKEAFETFDLSRGKGEYEYKQFEVEENDFFVSVFAEVGMVGDEGTAAAIICRDRIHLFVGKRGGITYPGTTKKGRFIRRPFRGYWATMLDQKYW